MSAQDASPTAPSPPFLTPPRELRDYIYLLCAQATPRSYGPLTGYCEPRTELLTVNKQIREEYGVVFYKQLVDILGQNRVCLKLASGKKRVEIKKYCIGWHFWRIPGTPLHLSNAAGDRRAVEGGLQIWFHQIPGDEDGDLSWWMDVFHINDEFESNRPPLSQHVRDIANLLEKIVTHSKVDASKLRRVKIVQQKLQAEVKRDDMARKASSLSMGDVLHALRSSVSTTMWSQSGSATTS